MPKHAHNCPCSLCNPEKYDQIKAKNERDAQVAFARELLRVQGDMQMADFELVRYIKRIAEDR